MNNMPSFIPGVPMYGVKDAPPQFAQGCDFIVEAQLYYKGEPIIDITNWTITAYVKKSLKAQNVIWHGGMDTGLKQKAGTNIFYFKIPAEASSCFLTGSYYYTFRGETKMGTGEPFDVTATLASGMFTVMFDAASPNPKLATTNVIAYDINEYEQTWAMAIETTESTEPEPPPLI